MAIPNYPKNFSQKVILTPKDHFEADKDVFPDNRAPKAVIFCYEEYILEYVKSNYKVSSGRFWTAEIIILQDEYDGIAIVGNFGIGGPASTHLFEILIAQGIENYIMIGHAGGLQKNNPAGTVILCEKAVRDEGVSYHYLPEEMYAYASDKMTNAIRVSLDNMNIPYENGSTWTIDSMYRETIDEIKYYSGLGIDTVEMEAASMFAVAQFRKVSIGALFVISDIVALEEWDEHLHSDDTQQSIIQTFIIAIDSLRGID
ncbi:TPA: nucleoside phosphorylase [Elizabethkingia anophelis]|nr:nucleoside phosphorylase [Elizabethkingia anophelis]